MPGKHWAVSEENDPVRRMFARQCVWFLTPICRQANVRSFRTPAQKRFIDFNPRRGFQGITSGWGDWYYKQLTGQWIDITGIPEGDYIARVTINAAGAFDEGENRYPNVVETSIHVPDPRNKVTIDNSPELIDH